MNAIKIHTEQGDYLICQPGSGLISNEQDILDVLAYGYGMEQNRLIIHATELHPDFF